mmetsp:Transcript_1684/g.2854  ORF Transcript_1684/g.2854 Transcript_1684/m.2854 type:complete len:94 (+) Transcript_1684:95-376(+)
MTLPSCPLVSSPKSRRLTLVAMTFALLVAIVLVQRAGCEDSPDTSSSTGLWRLPTGAPRAESVNMASLFVAGVLTKGVSRLVASEQLLWVSAL